MRSFNEMFPNMNLGTGIHYGCISQHSVDLSSLDDWYDHDAIYDDTKNEIEEGIRGILNEYLDPVDVQQVVDDALDRYNENYQNDEPAFYFEDKEYSAEFSQSLVCWIIKKSPFYTYCNVCSPCVPNAGDLDSPVTPDTYEGERMVVKAYCLPDVCFEDDKAPYTYFEVGNVE